MSPSSSLSGLLEFGTHTPSDMASTRSPEPAPVDKNASFKKSLDQAVQHQRQQTSTKTPDRNGAGTAPGSDAKSDSSVAEAGEPTSASAETPNGEIESVDSAPNVLPGVVTPDSGRTHVVGGAAITLSMPLDPDTGIAVDMETDVELPTLDAPIPVIEVGTTPGELIDADINGGIVDEIPVVPAPVLPDAEFLVSERQTSAAALMTVPASAAEESGLRLPRSLHELRFSEFLQKQPGGVVPGNASMAPIAPASPAGLESLIMFDEGALTLEADVDWVIDESNLSLSSMSKAASAPQMSNLTAGEAQRISVPVTVVFGHERWQQLAAERTVTLLQQGIKSAELMLDPPELGPLQVRIQMQNDQAVIHFTSANAAVRDALDQTFPRLREMLQEQGVELLQADVSDQSSNNNAEGERDDDRGPMLSQETEVPPESVLDPATQRHSLVLNSGIDDFA